MNVLNTLPGKLPPASRPDCRKPLRVALVSSSSGSRGGGELYLTGLARGLTDLGHEVQSVLSDHDRMDELEAMLAPYGRVHRLHFRNTYDRRLRSFGTVLARRGIRRIRGQLAELRPDVIHVNKQNIEDGLDLLAAADRAGAGLVSTVHITRSMRTLRARGGTMRDWIAGRVLRASACELIAIARSGLADLAGLGIEQSRLHLVHNGVSEPPPGDRDVVRRGWGCGPEHLVLGCVARLVPQKNPLFLASLLPLLPPNVRLVWIGDGSLREPLQQRVRELKMEDRVVLPGWQPDARSLMAGFDIFVLPSLFEGFPLAILEAMAAALPCVVSDVDGVEEAVVDGQTGYLCPPDAREIRLSRLASCVLDEAARARCGRAASARYRDLFSLDAMARKTAEIYQRLVRS